MQKDFDPEHVLRELSALIDLLASIKVALGEMEMAEPLAKVSKAMDHLYQFEHSVVIMQRFETCDGPELEKIRRQVAGLSKTLGLEGLAQLT